MRDLLGGKGAGLAEMTRLGLPVPPGFTITTKACNAYARSGRFPPGLWKQVEDGLSTVEAKIGRRFGDPTNPLLVSVRSGAKFSMPGMMDTILNLGLNDVTVKALAARTGNDRFAWDSYRRFIQMYGNVVLQINKRDFDEIFDHIKQKANAKLDTEIPVAALQEIVLAYKALVKEKTKADFPNDPRQQLQGA